MAEPGEHLGLRLAHNVLADVTQDSLSSFHNAGLGTTTVGQSLQNIIDGQSGGGMTIAVLSPHKITRTAQNMVHRSLKYYIVRITNNILEDPEDNNFWYRIGRELGKISGPADIPLDDLIIMRFYLDYRKLLQDNRTLEYISNQVFSGYNVYFSPDFMGMIDVHISSLTEVTDIMQLVDVSVGVPNILEHNIIDDTIVTKGSNIQDVFMHRCVDSVNTKSTDIYDVESNLGLEAARQVVYQEILAGCKDQRSASFMADFMTCKGIVSAFKKDNPMLKDKGFLASIAFERPKGDIKNILAGDEPIHTTSSVYAQMVAGLPPNVGSGSHLFELRSP